MTDHTKPDNKTSEPPYQLEHAAAEIAKRLREVQKPKAPSPKMK